LVSLNQSKDYFLITRNSNGLLSKKGLSPMEHHLGAGFSQIYGQQCNNVLGINNSDHYKSVIDIDIPLDM